MLLPYLVFAEYTLVGMIPTSRDFWEYHSSFGQKIESVLGGIQPKVIMMHVFYHMNTEIHSLEDR